MNGGGGDDKQCLAKWKKLNVFHIILMYTIKIILFKNVLRQR